MELIPENYNEFSRFFFQGNNQEKNLVMVSSLNELPDDEDDNELDFCTVQDAISYVQQLGCARVSQHKIRSRFHALVLAVLKWYCQHKGEIFPVVYRGVRDDRPDQDHLILFGSTELDVAKFYGNQIKNYSNIRGIKYSSSVKSVVTDDWSKSDIEIIFFPKQQEEFDVAS